MRINSINNSVNFGYNKQLNDKVNKKLENAKGNRELAQTLLKLNKFCMETEDKIRKAEEAKNQRLVDEYSRVFLTMKPMTTEIIDERFPLLNYRKTEMETYKEEQKERGLVHADFHWLTGTIEELMSDEEFLAATAGEFGSLDEEFDITSTNDATKTKKSRATKCDALELFVPNEYSPKGFDSLGGMQKLKEELYDKLIFPIKEPELAKLDEIEYGKKSPRGILLYGPPGCGKTMLMQAIAGESGLPLYNLKVGKAGSKYVNESASNIQEAFDYLEAQVKETGKPVLLAMDEMEAIAKKRSSDSNHNEDNKVVSTLLPLIEDARGKGIIIIGATNNYDELDDAIKSRFDNKLYIGLPDDELRGDVLKIHLNKISKGRKLAGDSEDLQKVVGLTRGFSIRDITILLSKAALIARKDGRRDIMANDFIQPVVENQNMKVKEDRYRDKQTRPSAGFVTK